MKGAHEDTFNQLLEEYLLSKKNWIIESKKEDDSRYWIDFLCLGVCAYVFDIGLKIGVESEYIPSWVYQGEFTQV